MLGCGAVCYFVVNAVWLEYSVMAFNIQVCTLGNDFCGAIWLEYFRGLLGIFFY